MNNSFVLGSVLVGVDGSAGSDRALAWAATYAQDWGRPLVVVHVSGLPVVTDFGVDMAETEEGLLAAGRQVTQRAVETVAAEHPTLAVTEHRAIGDPRAVLTQLAEGASVLVLGSRGRGALASLLLGSVSVALAAQAPCPVVVVRPPLEHLPSQELSVVVGLAGDEDAADALTIAFELASAAQRPLEVVHSVGAAIVFPYPDLAVPELTERLTQAADQLTIETVEGYARKFPEVVVRRRLVYDSPTQALVTASRSAAVVVVGCRGRGPAKSHLLGSVSRSVVERAHCTVVVARGGRQ